nr:hypothetical protein CFP56_41259 [Quercus suber]
MGQPRRGGVSIRRYKSTWVVQVDNRRAQPPAPAICGDGVERGAKFFRRVVDGPRWRCGLLVSAGTTTTRTTARRMLSFDPKIFRSPHSKAATILSKTHYWNRRFVPSKPSLGQDSTSQAGYICNAVDCRQGSPTARIMDMRPGLCLSSGWSEALE